MVGQAFLPAGRQECLPRQTVPLPVAGHLSKKLTVWTLSIAKIRAAKAAKPAESTSARELANLLPLEEFATAKTIASPEHEGFSKQLSIAGAGRYLVQVAGGSQRSTLRVYDLVDARCLFELPEVAQHRQIGDAVLSAHGKAVAFVGIKDERSALEIWNVATGKRSQRHTDWKGSVDALAFSPDDKYLATGSAIETVRDPEDAKWPRAIVTQSEIRLWDPSTGTQLAHFPAHPAAIRSLAFSTDGKRLASGSADSTILIWDLRQAKKLGSKKLREKE